MLLLYSPKLYVLVCILYTLNTQSNIKPKYIIIICIVLLDKTEREKKIFLFYLKPYYVYEENKFCKLSIYIWSMLVIIRSIL